MALMSRIEDCQNNLLTNCLQFWQKKKLKETAVANIAKITNSTRIASCSKNLRTSRGPSLSFLFLFLVECPAVSAILAIFAIRVTQSFQIARKISCYLSAIFAKFATFPRPLLAFSLLFLLFVPCLHVILSLFGQQEKCQYFRDCAKFADFSRPSLSFSLSNSRILLNVLFLRYLLLSLFR